MKQINVWFDDEEHKKIAKEKNKIGLNWHDFILYLINKGISENEKRS